MDSKFSAALRRAAFPLTAGALAIGAFFGLPVVKAAAAEQDRNIRPMPLARLLPADLNIVRPETVSPSSRKLLSLANQAMADAGLARRLSLEPDSIAAEHGLSEIERQVLRHMTPQQFEIAREDAARVSAQRVAEAGNLPGFATNERTIANGMVVGRAILAAMGRSYLEAANAHSCCPWGKAIQLGPNAERVLYDRIFDANAVLDVRQPALDSVQPAIRVRPVVVPKRD